MYYFTNKIKLNRAIEIAGTDVEAVKKAYLDLGGELVLEEEPKESVVAKVKKVVKKAVKKVVKKK